MQQFNYLDMHYGRSHYDLGVQSHEVEQRRALREQQQERTLGRKWIRWWWRRDRLPVQT